MSYSRLSAIYKRFVLTVDTKQEPRSYQEACRDPRRVAAVKNEIEALERSGIWMLTHFPPNKRVVGCKWVYKVKHNADGTVERFKARLVVKGYM